jgi:hypothetical protein
VATAPFSGFALPFSGGCSSLSAALGRFQPRQPLNPERKNPRHSLGAYLPEVMTDTTQDRLHSVAVGALQMAALQPSIHFHVTGDRLQRRAAAKLLLLARAQLPTAVDDFGLGRMPVPVA